MMRSWNIPVMFVAVHRIQCLLAGRESSIHTYEQLCALDQGVQEQKCFFLPY